jgi:hypothetical protein
MSHFVKYDTFSLTWREDITQQGWAQIKVQRENHTSCGKQCAEKYILSPNVHDIMMSQA